MSEALTVDDLTFEVHRSAKRKTLEITVDRAGKLSISAPPGVADDVMADFVRENPPRLFWRYCENGH